MNKLSLGVAVAVVLGTAMSPVAAPVRVAQADTTCRQIFTSKSDFLSKTGATSATGSLPNLGAVSNGTQLGSLRISATSEGDFWVGAAGAPEITDWTSLMGNELAFGWETFRVDSGSVYGIGFDFVEPQNTYGTEMSGNHNARIGTQGYVDSSFQVTLLNNGQVVDSFTYNSPNDTLAFNGIWTDQAFNQVTISDLSGNMDDEYWGEFYTTTTSRASQCVTATPTPTPTSTPDKPQCSDNKDNDGDGLEDVDDPGCHTDSDLTKKYNPDDNDERNGQCSDKKDNDGDKLIDRKDPDCHTDNNPNNDDSFDGDRDEDTDNRVKAAVVKVSPATPVAVTAKTGAGSAMMILTLAGAAGLGITRRFLA